MSLARGGAVEAQHYDLGGHDLRWPGDKTARHGNFLRTVRGVGDHTAADRAAELLATIFALSFAMGVVTGIVMAFQFGTNWSALSERTGSIMGPLLGYEGFTAFLLEATFFGVLLLGRDLVPPWFYFLSCCMVSLGTMFSSFWILANNSWMQVPLGHAIVDGKIVPDSWWATSRPDLLSASGGLICCLRRF